MRKAKKRSMERKKRTKRTPWSAADVKELRSHSKNKEPVAKISRTMKRTVGALRQKALQLGIPLGHRR
jgi:hypothetical protein